MLARSRALSWWEPNSASLHQTQGASEGVEREFAGLLVAAAGAPSAPCSESCSSGLAGRSWRSQSNGALQRSMSTGPARADFDDGRPGLLAEIWARRFEP